MMLTKLKIKNFKCFVENEVCFAPLTLLVGGNGAGKSSVIQALLLARQSIDRVGLREKVMQNRGISPSFDVRLNGSYLLQLGQAVNVIASNATTNQIEFSLVSDSGDQVSFAYSDDGVYANHLLKGRILSYNTNIPLNGCFGYLNAERLGPKKALDMAPFSHLDVGFQGEYTSYVLYKADNDKRNVHDFLKLENDSNRFLHQVQAWLNLIIPNVALSVHVINEMNMLAFEYKNTILDTSFCPPPGTGFGISYALPIIVAGLILSTEENVTLIVENPEAHLHPLSQSRMGRFLALLALTGIQVIVETHSEHIVNGARIQMLKQNAVKNLQINFFSQDQEQQITQILLNEYGELSEWPEGFFDQEQKDLHELFLLRKGMSK